MPYPVQHLIAGRPKPVTTRMEDSILKALGLMIEYDFSQLPVIDDEEHPIGMVTYESILRGVRNFHSPLDNLHVRDLVASAPECDLGEDMFVMLEKMRSTNVALIVDSRRVLVGIVTSYDSTEYFRDRAENLMNVESIEMMIRDFIRLAFTQEDGKVNENALSDAINKVTPQNQIGEEKLKSFEDLSLSQYVSLIVSRHSWPVLEPMFKIDRDALRKLLEDVCNTRNNLAHFREISAEQIDQLRFCRKWLERCAQGARKGQPKPVEEKECKKKEEEIQQEVITEAKPGESRYAPIATWLNSQPAKTDRITVSFQEVEEIIGGELPSSAYSHHAWWANDAQGHPHAGTWLDAGWRTSSVNLTDKHLTLSRIEKREKAHIKFFSELLSIMKNEFPLKDVSPNGSTWIPIQTITTPGFAVGQFVFGFIKNRKFRVELYIDTIQQQTTKAVFDRIYLQKDLLEAKLGEISWERIDNKRASRIAIYHPGEIMDSEDKLDDLKMWAAEKMIAFYKILEPVASEAFEKVLLS
jgi:CBS domain-containing protein